MVSDNITVDRRLAAFRMPSGKHLLEDFLLPALESAAFGRFLEWVDPNEKIFKVLYHHKNGHKWSEDAADVFVAWDKLKGRIRDTEDYFTKSRQRFRVALRKCPKLQKLQPSPFERHVEVFKILPQKKPKSKYEARLKDLVSENGDRQNLGKNAQNYNLYEEAETFILPNKISVIQTKSEIIPADGSKCKNPQTSVIVTPEGLRELLLCSKGLSVNSKTNNGMPLLDKIKSEKPDEIETPISPVSVAEFPIDNGQAKDLSKSSNSLLPGTSTSRPLTLEQQMPMPVPEQTSSLEVPQNKARSEGKRLVEDFLLPALNTKAYGKYLEWVDPKVEKTFKVLFQHKNAHTWSQGSVDVFVAWDKMKGRIPETVDYYSRSRQRFRIALTGCPRLEKLPVSDNKRIEIFKILSYKRKKKVSAPYRVTMERELERFLIPDTVIFQQSGIPVIQSIITLRKRPPNYEKEKETNGTNMVENSKELQCFSLQKGLNEINRDIAKT